MQLFYVKKPLRLISPSQLGKERLYDSIESVLKGINRDAMECISDNNTFSQNESPPTEYTWYAAYEELLLYQSLGNHLITAPLVY